MKIFNPTLDVDKYSKSDNGIFLAGPTPRDDKTVSWREHATILFSASGFKGELFIPEPFCNDKKKQVDWETHHLEAAKVIMFWIPRDLETLPGLTTNIELGEWLKSGKIVLGIPFTAEKVGYIEYRAEKLGIQVYRTLQETVACAAKNCP